MTQTINECTFLRPSEATEFVTFGPAETHGAYVAMVGGVSAGEPGPPVHIHPHTDEAFYVASGEATFLLGDRELEVSSGGFVFVPRGVAHTVWNSGSGPVRGVIVVSPADAEHVFLPVDAV